jgi:hypothetical protein
MTRCAGRRGISPRRDIYDALECSLEEKLEGSAGNFQFFSLPQCTAYSPSGARNKHVADVRIRFFPIP